jgi:hypothetical protein
MTTVLTTCPACREVASVDLRTVHVFVCTEDESHNAMAFPCPDCGLQTKALDHYTFNTHLRPAGVAVSYFRLAEVLQVQAEQICAFADALDDTLARILDAA